MSAPPLAPAPSIDSIAAPVAKKRRLRWPGIVFPVLFLLLVGMIAYIVLDLTGFASALFQEEPNTPEASLSQPANPPINGANANATPVSISPGPNGNPQPMSPERFEEHDLNPDGGLPPTPRINLNSQLPTSPSARITDEPTNPANILEKFLLAKTLEARLPYMSNSKLSPEELKASALGLPFPEIINRRSIEYMENANDRHREHFFEVFFQMNPNQRPVPILIQLNDWGDGKFLIHTDAFLDLYENKLGTFAESPVKGVHTFYVVADAYKHCFDDIIPDWEKKSVLKLRAHSRMAPRLVAYFNRNSAIADQISEPHALPWGESGICTVTVEWNTETPKRPFVEVRRIDSFTWPSSQQRLLPIPPDRDKGLMPHVLRQLRVGLEPDHPEGSVLECLWSHHDFILPALFDRLYFKREIFIRPAGL